MRKQTSGNYVLPPGSVITTALLEPLCSFVDCMREAEFGRTAEVTIFGVIYEIKICSEHYMALRFVV